MFQNAWRRWLQGSKKRPLRGRRTYRPFLEMLEDRTLPSTFTVLNTNDSGGGQARRGLTANDLSVVDTEADSGGAHALRALVPASATPPDSLAAPDLGSDLPLASPGAVRVTIPAAESQGLGDLLCWGGSSDPGSQRLGGDGGALLMGGNGEALQFSGVERGLLVSGIGRDLPTPAPVVATGGPPAATARIGSPEQIDQLMSLAGSSHDWGAWSEAALSTNAIDAVLTGDSRLNDITAAIGDDQVAIPASVSESRGV